MNSITLIDRYGIRKRPKAPLSFPIPIRGRAKSMRHFGTALSQQLAGAGWHVYSQTQAAIAEAVPAELRSMEAAHRIPLHAGHSVLESAGW